MHENHKIRRFLAAICGILATILWSFTPHVYAQLVQLPLFEILSLAFTSGFAVIFVITLWSRRFDRDDCLSPRQWFVLLAGMYISGVVYFFGFRHAEPSQVVIIYYLWPIVFLFQTSFLTHEKITKMQYLATFTALLAIYVAFFHDKLLVLTWQNWMGYSFALLGAILWSNYVLGLRSVKSLPFIVLTYFFGAGMVVSIALHLLFEITVVPSFSQLVLGFILGACCNLVGLILWQIGIGCGPAKFLVVFSYTTPLFAVLWLMLFGRTPFDPFVIGACVVIVTCSTIAMRSGEASHISSKTQA